MLSISDEKHALGDLFKRSATLVLVPTQTYTSAAYENATSASTGLLSRAYGLVSGAVSAVWNLTNSAPQTEDRPPPSRRGGERVGTGADVRRPVPSGSQVRTLGDQDRDSDERKYYNGNQVCFTHGHSWSEQALTNGNSSALSQSQMVTEIAPRMCFNVYVTRQYIRRSFLFSGVFKLCSFKLIFPRVFDTAPRGRENEREPWGATTRGATTCSRVAQHNTTQASCAPPQHMHARAGILSPSSTIPIESLHNFSPFELAQPISLMPPTCLR